MRSAVSGSGRRRLLRLTCFFLVTLQGCLVTADFWGVGWEDPVTRLRKYKALKVERDPTSQIAQPDVVVDDNFNWVDFELNSAGGRGRVRSISDGAAGAGTNKFEPQPLQAWQPRHDAVQHGHYMLYRMDDAVTQLADGRTMEEMLFSISMDVGVHPSYTSAHSSIAAAVNCSVRFSIYEQPPEDLGAEGRFLEMVDYSASHQTEVRGGNEEDLDTRRHNLLWGVVTDPITGSLAVGNGSRCTRPVRQLYIGVQCLIGYAFPTGSCTIDPTVPPRLDDCARYCPFTLTVRPMPRVIRPNEAVNLMLSPGQWAAFELHVDEYSLLDVTIDRPEYSNVSFPQQAWRDGFSGRAWLARDACVTGANVTVVHADGYCPHGGELRVDPVTFEDVSPHRFCSRDYNFSHELLLPPGTQFERSAVIDPHHGELDDLGFYATQLKVAERRAALEESMHFPTQLKIRAQIAEYERTLARLHPHNNESTWRRRWPMRLCAGATEAGRYVLTVYADIAMDTRAHSGSFLLNVTSRQFDRSPLMDRVPRAGCLRKGGAETFVLQTPPAFPERTAIGSAEVRSYYVNDGTNRVSALMVRQSLPPSANDFDAAVYSPSRLRVAMSACDVTASQTWFLRVELGNGAEEPSEAFFEIIVELEDATRALGDEISGRVCCGQYKYYAFPAVPEHAAPRVAFNLSSGRLKAVYWRYASCPIEEYHVRDGTCTGWCVVDWYRIFSGNLGKPRYSYSGTLQVPFGMGDQPDKRRGGTWYLGIQALDGIEAEYSLTTGSRSPVQLAETGCDRLDWYCHMPDRFKDVFVSAAPSARVSMAGARRAATACALAAGALLVFLARSPR